MKKETKAKAIEYSVGFLLSMVLSAGFYALCFWILSFSNYFG